jgi:quercetin dioxygenase-like cupin family protein
MSTTTPATYAILPNLADAIASVPADSIVSKTLFQGDRLRIILFGFAPGQELSEHTSTREAVLHFLRGEADVTLGGEPTTGSPGTVIRMAPNLPHSIVARTETIMLLHMFG